jgi:hypothetical protein
MTRAPLFRLGTLTATPGALAALILERLQPEATVVPLRCEGLPNKGGVLNCVAWTVDVEKRDEKRPALTT